HVHLAGWHVTPTFRLGPSREDELRTILAELAERIPVRVLVWAGAPLPLFRPSRNDVRRVREALERGTRIRCGLDDRERPMHCHHEKLVVVDDRVAFVGGIDLTSYAGNRLDTRDHPARGAIGWHDAAARLESQFLWSPEIVAILADKLRRPPADGFRLVVLLPAKPLSGADDTRGQLGVLAAADDGAGRFLACTLRQRGAHPKPVYVHAKIG